MEVQKRRWIPPEYGTYKVNVDGACDTSKRVAGLGVVVRNWEGKFIAGYAKRLPGGSSPIVAEALAIFNGMKLACDLNLYRLSYKYVDLALSRSSAIVRFDSWYVFASSSGIVGLVVCVVAILWSWLDRFLLHMQHFLVAYAAQLYLGGAISGGAIYCHMQLLFYQWRPSPFKLDSDLAKKDGSGDVNLEKEQGIFEASLARVSSGFDTTKYGEALSQPLDSAQGRRGSSTIVEASLKGFSPVKMGSLKIQSCAKGDHFGNALTMSVAIEALTSEDKGEESEETALKMKKMRKEKQRGRPWASIILAELAKEAGLPDGVLNIVHGTDKRWKLENALDGTFKDLVTLKSGAFVVAPCAHDGHFPLDNTGKYCHFVRRLVRTTSQGCSFETLKEQLGKRNPDDLEIDEVDQFETEVEDVPYEDGPVSYDYDIIETDAAIIENEEEEDEDEEEETASVRLDQGTHTGL
ncbi:5-oxoprolinase (ATP-hydrolyzing) [Sarracenia purpurea var. burkii]